MTKGALRHPILPFLPFRLPVVYTPHAHYPTMAIEKGDTAPDFTVKSTDKSDFTLSEHLKKNPVLLNFYAGDFGINCTIYMTKFAERYEEILATGVEFVAINPDSMDMHESFKSRVKLPWEFLHDKDQEVSKAFGAIVGPGHMTTGFTNREFFLIGQDGKVLWTWKAPVPKTLPDFDETLNAIKEALQ